MKCKVLRPFPGPDGKMFQPGERVNTAEWRNRETLIRARYIQPAFLSSGFEKKVLDTAEPEPEYMPSPPAVRALKKKKRRVPVDDEE